MRTKAAELKQQEDWEAIAVSNIEKHLGDVVEEGMSPDEVYEEAYALAFDALVDRDLDIVTAGGVASRVAQRFAQP